MLRTAALGSICLMSLMTAQTAASAQTIEISVYHNEQDDFGDTMRWWIDEINKRTDGRIVIEPVYNGALARVTETLDAVRDNVVPMGIALASFMSGVVPALGYVELIGALPYEEDEAISAINDIWPNMKAVLEPQGVVPLWGQTAFGTGVICRDAHLKTRADWEGETIRAAGRWQSRQVEAMGGSPVPIDTGEIYIALQNGTVNCALMNPTIVASLRLFEVAPYYTNLELPSNIVTYIVNKDVWEDIDEADRAIVEEVSAEAMDRGIAHIKEAMSEQIETITGGGGQVYTASEEERQAFIDASGPIFEEISEAAGADSEPFAEVLGRYR